MIALDTNVLIGGIQTFDPELRVTARRAVKSLYRQGEQLVCFPQNLVEFWNASTRPANANGLGFSPEQAARYVDRFQSLLRLLHEARIVAAMTVHKVTKILSFDLDDFKRYTGISALHPKDVK